MESTKILNINLYSPCLVLMNLQENCTMIKKNDFRNVNVYRCLISLKCIDKYVFITLFIDSPLTDQHYGGLIKVSQKYIQSIAATMPFQPPFLKKDFLY